MEGSPRKYKPAEAHAEADRMQEHLAEGADINDAEKIAMLETNPRLVIEQFISSNKNKESNAGMANLVPHLKRRLKQTITSDYLYTIHSCVMGGKDRPEITEHQLDVLVAIAILELRDMQAKKSVEIKVVNNKNYVDQSDYYSQMFDFVFQLKLNLLSTHHRKTGRVSGSDDYWLEPTDIPADKALVHTLHDLSLADLEDTLVPQERNAVNYDDSDDYQGSNLAFIQEKLRLLEKAEPEKAKQIYDKLIKEFFPATEKDVTVFEISNCRNGAENTIKKTVNGFDSILNWRDGDDRQNVIWKLKQDYPDRYRGLVACLASMRPEAPKKILVPEEEFWPSYLVEDVEKFAKENSPEGKILFRIECAVFRPNLTFEDLFFPSDYADGPDWLDITNDSTPDGKYNGRESVNRFEYLVLPNLISHYLPKGADTTQITIAWERKKKTLFAQMDTLCTGFRESALAKTKQIGQFSEKWDFEKYEQQFEAMKERLHGVRRQLKKPVESCPTYYAILEEMANLLEESCRAAEPRLEELREAHEKEEEKQQREDEANEKMNDLRTLRVDYVRETLEKRIEYLHQLYAASTGLDIGDIDGQVGSGGGSVASVGMSMSMSMRQEIKMQLSHALGTNSYIHFETDDYDDGTSSNLEGMRRRAPMVDWLVPHEVAHMVDKALHEPSENLIANYDTDIDAIVASGTEEDKVEWVEQLRHTMQESFMDGLGIKMALRYGTSDLNDQSVQERIVTLTGAFAGVVEVISEKLLQRGFAADNKIFAVLTAIRMQANAEHLLDLAKENEATKETVQKIIEIQTKTGDLVDKVNNTTDKEDVIDPNAETGKVFGQSNIQEMKNLFKTALEKAQIYPIEEE